MKCPDKQCRQQVLPHVVRELVDAELFAKYERFLLDRSLNSMNDVMWCPHCSAAVIIDENIQLGACAQCKFSFCTICLQLWHPGTPCKSSEKMLEAMKTRAAGKKNAEMEKVTQEIDSMKYLLLNSRMCPTCRTHIEKTEGCNKMTCYKCGNYFCWQCGSKIGGYDHFHTGKCQLFPNTPLYNPNFDAGGGEGGAELGAFGVELNRQQLRQLNDEMDRMRRQILMANNPANVGRCPKCRREMPRRNRNNHMVCWGCKAQFCFLCSELIYGTAHFNKGGCVQHTT